MKSILALSLLVTSIAQASCPDMTGTWKLDWRAQPHPDEVQSMTVTQSPIPGGVRYDGVSTLANGDVIRTSTSADGVMRQETQTQDGMTSTVQTTIHCEPNRLRYATVIQWTGNGAPPFTMNATTLMELSGNTIVVSSQWESAPLTEQARYTRQ
jgi:hypothetical protein